MRIVLKRESIVRMTVLLALVAAAVGAADARQNQNLSTAKPLVSAYKTNGIVPGFLVEARNMTSSGLQVLTAGRCHPKIDGRDIDTTVGGSSGGGRNVGPGESWKELWRLVVARDPTGRRLPNPDPRNITGNVQIVVQLTPGKHTIAFACGGSWSDDLTFEWKADSSVANAGRR